MTDGSLESLVRNLLLPLWSEIDSDYKRKYAIQIWDQFESAIRGATSATTIGQFVESFRRRIPCVSRSDAATIATYALALEQDDMLHQQVLRRLRNETSILVMIVRAKNEERKQAVATPTLFDMLDEPKATTPTPP